MGLRTMQQCRQVADAVLAAVRQQAGKAVSLCVEGNISAGKSTFLREIERELRLKQCIQVCLCSASACGLLTAAFLET